MAMKLTLRQLQEQLPTVLDRAVETGDEYVVQRNGEDYDVILSAREWKRRATGKRLDALGPAYRLPKAKQERAEELLVRSKRHRLTTPERRELNALLRECDALLVRRAKAMDQLS